MTYKRFLFILIASSVIYGCSKTPDKKFQVIDPEDSGVHFSNTIEASDSFNVIDFYYIYNGGGVGIGDFNNDGKQDVYFSGNEVSNTLYLNKGDFQFEDITKEAGVEAADIWSQGVAVADINHDGWMDMYVCASIFSTDEKRINKLFINNGLNKDGIPTFREEAQKWGIDEKGHSSNAAFFDFDLDGDLDLFILNNYMDRLFPSQFRPAIVDGSSVNSDKLYENLGNETFKDISEKAGILIEGYSHGIAIRDINLDGWPDVYVTNDFLPNDILYVNNQDGTFSNNISDYLKHQCFSAMGNDIADINNDGLQEIMALDMLPEINYRKKTMILRSNPMNQLNYDKFNYDYQFIRNMIHLNMGPDGKGNMLYGEIGFLSGIYETDWSWSPLFADFDNDGYKDFVVANGFPGDVTDMDFATYMNKYQNYILKRSDVFDTIPEVLIDNYILKNNGDLTFTKKTKEWGFEAKTFSNGAAFADFDNDGDLDYITNNINGPATLYQNNTVDLLKPEEKANYLRISLEGSITNPGGIGAKVIVFAGDQKLFYEQSPYRGFMSTMDPMIHVGLGELDNADSIIVFWPERTISKVGITPANQELQISFKDGIPAGDVGVDAYLLDTPKKPLFSREDSQAKIPFLHQEKDLFDFNYQRTIPHKLSQYTPGIAINDINGDGMEDVYIGGNSLYPGAFMLQDSKGNFRMENRFNSEAKFESKDHGLLFFDADGDNDDDLYIVSGGIEKDVNDPSLTDRLYLNDGSGYFSYNKNALPDLRKSGSCVKAADFDKDGDLDLFVGTRTIPGEYPYAQSSHILLNDKGRFTDDTYSICPGLDSSDMVTDAIWTDFDNDTWIDLIVVGEWTGISFFKNEQGKLVDISRSALTENSTGWWNCISGADIDNDGDTDYICGNLGLNSIFQGDSSYPLSIYASDYDLNGIIDPIIVKYISDEHFELKPFPISTRDDLIMQVAILKQRFPTYRGFGRATIDDLLTPEELEGSYHRTAEYFRSTVLLNDGNGKFSLVPLPQEAQIAPIFGILTQDYDRDGNLDIVVAGNDYSIELMSGRIDSSNGLVLLGNGDGSFRSLKSYQSGFFVKSDVKGMASMIDATGKELILATQNKDSLITHELNTDDVLNTIDPKNAIYAEIKLKNGKTRFHEFYYGSSYLSQSSRKMVVPNYVESVTLYDKDNKPTVISDF